MLPIGVKRKQKKKKNPALSEETVYTLNVNLYTIHLFLFI